MLEKAELDGESDAFTLDRTLLSQGRDQRNGTQKSERDGRAVIEQLEDPARLNARRVLIALEQLNPNPPIQQRAAWPVARRERATNTGRGRKRR